ncbi:hypothetical protein D3C76_1161820 [compost metagenome]
MQQGVLHGSAFRVQDGYVQGAGHNSRLAAAGVRLILGLFLGNLVDQRDAGIGNGNATFNQIIDEGFVIQLHLASHGADVQAALTLRFGRFAAQGFVGRAFCFFRRALLFFGHCIFLLGRRHGGRCSGWLVCLPNFKNGVETLPFVFVGSLGTAELAAVIKADRNQ